MPTATLDDPEIRDWPLWWFARLNTAIERGYHDDARHALSELARLGIEVRFLLPPGEVCRDD